MKWPGGRNMVAVKSVKVDGESIHIFKSALYIFESNEEYTLQLDIIVSEVMVKKYNKEENLIIEIELEDGKIIESIMHLNIIPGGLPQLNLSCEIDDLYEYEDLNTFHENDSSFPNIEEGISLNEIREVEMPYEDVRLKLKLPIDQVEWMKTQKNKELNELFKEFIYEYWKKQESE
jgi:hypothetical protein